MPGLNGGGTAARGTSGTKTDRDEVEDGQRNKELSDTRSHTQ